MKKLGGLVRRAKDSYSKALVGHRAAKQKCKFFFIEPYL